MGFDVTSGDGHHFDILIKNNDLVLDDNDPIVYTDARPSIAQDIGNMIKESQILVQMIAERNPVKRSLFLTIIESLVEDDLRIIPGTASVTEPELEAIWVKASTYEYNMIDFYL